MLGNGNAGAGHDERRASRDVVRAFGVAARAAGVDGAFRRTHRDSARAQGAGRAGNLIHRLAAGTHAHQQRADLRLAGAARHDRVEGLGRLALGECLARSHLAQVSAEIGRRR